MTDGLESAGELPDARTSPEASGRMPWLGHAIRMMPDALAFLTEGYRKIGPVFRFRIPGRSYVTLAGPEANRLLQQREHELFSSRLTYPLLLRESGTPYYLNAMDGDEHLAYRRQVRPRMAADLPQAWREEIRAAAEEAADRWAEAGRIRVLEEMQRLFLDAFGLILSGQGAGEHRLAFDRFVRTFITAGAGVKPKWMLRTPGYVRAKSKLRGYLAGRFEAEVEGRSPDARPTWVRQLHGLQLPGGAPAGADEKLTLGMLPLLNSLLYVGRTATTLLHALLGDSDEQAGLMNEWSRTGPGPLWKGAVYEAIRLVPMAVSHPRIAKAPFEFGGYRFEPGTSVMMAVCVTHQLEEHFPEPQKFRSSRWVESAGKAYRPPLFAGFGLGPHACMGQEWVESVIPLVMGTLLSRLRFRIDPPDYRWKLDYDPVPGPPADFAVTVKRIEPSEKEVFA